MFRDLPALSAIPPWKTDDPAPGRLLTNRQREQLAAIATRVQVRRRAIIFRAHTAAASVYIVGDGIVKTFRDLPSGKRRVLGFLFPTDIFGLAEAGRYVNTSQAVTDVTVFRLPFEELKETLARDGALQMQILCKVTQELRAAQRHAIIVATRNAEVRLATFLRALEGQNLGRAGGTIHIPMSRLDVADYLGLSAEAVSRASRRLEQGGVVQFVDRHTARIIDRRQLDKLASAS